MDLMNLKKQIEKAEGRVPHMYQDTVGGVTVGVGHFMPDLKDAIALPFDPREAIFDDYHAVMAAPKGLRAASYSRYCRATLSDKCIDALLDVDLNFFIGVLRSNLPKFDSFPETVKQAVVDMAFNLGIAGFLKFSKLNDSLNAGDWVVCAEQCHRRGISEERNKATAELFRQAV